MTDQTPRPNPVDDRLRATFAQELTAVEQRRTGSTAIPPRRRLAAWAPLTIAAAAILLAGFFFVNNTGQDRAVELDVAAQVSETDGSDGQGESEDGAGDSDDSDDAGDADGPAEPSDDEDFGEIVTIPEPSGEVGAGYPGVIPAEPGRDICGFGHEFDPERVFAWGGGGDVPVIVEPVLGIDPVLAATIPSGTAVELPGGCTGGTGGGETATFYEIAEPAGWVRVEFLLTPAEYDAVLQQLTDEPAEDLNLTLCDQPIEAASTWFVTDVADDDPDGGLIAHTQAGVNEPVTRVIPPNGAVQVTGECAVVGGSRWLEIDRPGTSGEWVSSNFLTQARPACLVDFSSEEAPALGFAVSLSNSSIAWSDGEVGSSNLAQYDLYPATVVRFACETDPAEGLVCLTGTVTIYDYDIPDTIFSSPGPVDAVRTGVILDPDPGLNLSKRVEVTLPDNNITGFVSVTETGIFDGLCSEVAGPADSMESRPCEFDVEPTNSPELGSAESSADHVHNIRITSSADCTRIVIEVGENFGQDSDTASALAPRFVVQERTGEIRILFPDCSPPNSQCNIFSAGEIGPQQLTFEFGLAFVATNEQGQTYVSIPNYGRETSGFYLDGPGRIVVDLQPPVSGAVSGTAPIGLRHAILPDGLGSIQPGESVRGYGRPFEAVGTWHIFDVSGDGDFGISDSVASGTFLTTAGSGGWGEFEVTVPPLPDGDFVIAFGSIPPTGLHDFLGSGVRVEVAAGQATVIVPEEVVELLISDGSS